MNRRERILARLEEVGSSGPKRSLGQNFLVSDQVIERILFAVRSEPFTDLIEVGPGLGALTEDLLAPEILRDGRRFVAIELDREFAGYWRGRGIEVIEADALKQDWREIGLREGSLFVSNLPYQISSSLVIERSLEPAGITRMILMFQKEVAQRLRASHATKEYGLLTVIAQTFWEITTVCEAGPRDFFPPPNVASRVLGFRRIKRAEVDKPEAFLAFVKAAFSHRRKLLIKNLGVYGVDIVADALAAKGLKSTARAEELDPETFVRLYLAVTGNRGGKADG
jgi:16S rRNA (adenine1518-N6/adenine1519-N6)-dimethyltransferase